MLGKLEVEGGRDIFSFTDPNKRNLVSEVSMTKPRVFGKGNPVKVSVKKWFMPLRTFDLRECAVGINASSTAMPRA